MNHTIAQSCFSAYAAGELPPDERTAISAHLSECHECATAYQRFRGIVSLEKMIAEAEPLWEPVDLSDEIMSALDRGNRPRATLSPWWIPALVGSNITLMVVVLLMQLVPRFDSPRLLPASGLYGVNSLQNISYREDSGALRMVTVDLDTKLPTQIPLSNSTRADVTVTLDGGSEPRSEVLAQFVPVVAIELAAGSVPRASLLVSGETARRIDIARVVGSVRLSLYAARGQDLISPAPLNDPEGRPIGAELSPESVAVMFRPDPRRREPVRMVFSDGGWEEKRGVDVQAF